LTFIPDTSSLAAEVVPANNYFTIIFRYLLTVSV